MAEFVVNGVAKKEFTSGRITLTVQNISSLAFELSSIRIGLIVDDNVDLWGDSDTGKNYQMSPILLPDRGSDSKLYYLNFRNAKHCVLPLEPLAVHFSLCQVFDVRKLQENIEFECCLRIFHAAGVRDLDFTLCASPTFTDPRKFAS